MDPSSSSDSALLPQYGFGATYTFDALVEHHHFLYRVHTPKNRGTRSRATSPSPRSSSPFTPSRRTTLSRQPSSLSASVASIRSADSGPSDYFGSYVTEEEDGAPNDPYFLSRKFKDDLTSPDPGQRRRTISTLSTLSGGSGAYSFIGSDDGSDAESELASLRRRDTLSRSASSMMLGHSRVRSDSISSSGRPGAKRSQSADVGDLPAPAPAPAPQGVEVTENVVMTYSDLVRHLDWTTRSSSPYVTTSFSFFWCLWEAVRRYKLGVKHDVEIAIIDARKVRGRARTALEVLRSVEPEKQDKAYWKWYRFALESQDVLVFGAISGDAIYASIPLTQILPKLPSYFFVDDVVPKAIADPREPDPSRSPTSTQSHNSILPSTPSRARSPHGEREREREHDREALTTAHLLTKLAWDIGTTMKPIRKSKSKTKGTTPSRSPGGKPAPRHTSHAEFCKALSAAFARRSEADEMRDATTGAVGLAELLIEPWFRARCAEYVSYPFRHDNDSDDDEKMGEGDNSVCLGLAGDGCTLEHSHDSSIQDALFEKDEETEEEAAQREAAAVLSELALSLARWPAALWHAEHQETIEALVSDVVNMCVSEAARSMQGRLEWSIALEHQHHRTRNVSLSGSVRSHADTMSLSGSLQGSLRGEQRGREEARVRDRSRSRSPFSPSSTKHVRLASEDSHSPSPPSSRKASIRESPYKPRARSPLGASPVLGPAIVIRPKSKSKRREGEGELSAEGGKTEQLWAPSTPPPSPPRALEGELRKEKETPPKRRSPPPPPPPPRSARRPPSPSSSPSQSTSFSSLESALPSPNASPSPSASLTSSSSLLKKSVHRRAESIPGGWPNGNGDSSPEERPGSPAGKQAQTNDGKNKDQGDVFLDASMSVREQAKKRPVSWAGSGLALGALSSSPSSSAESLRAAVQRSPPPSPSPSSSTRRPPVRTQNEPQAPQTRERLLTEVVSSALGLGAGVGVVAGAEATKLGKPSRLETSSSSSSEAEVSERPLRHRRHSSHGVDVELSPVREAEQEEEAEPERELESEEKSRSEGVENEDATRNEEEEEEVQKGIEAEVVISGEVTSVSEVEIEKPVSLPAPETKTEEARVPEVPESEVEPTTEQPKSGTSTPRSERRSSRSGTLASIPEEDWADWSLVEAPSAAEYQYQDETVGSRIEESEIPLPPSPKLDAGELDVEVEQEEGPTKAEDARKVPEITLSVDTSVVENGDRAMVEGEQPGFLSPRSIESGAGEAPGALTRIFISPFNVSLREPLSKTRVFFNTFFIYPLANILRRVSPTDLPHLLSPLTPTRTPSPIFEDSHPPSGGVFARLSRFFSYFRIPLVHSDSNFFNWGRRRHRQKTDSQPSASSRSMETILAPAPRWDAPIPECGPQPQPQTPSTNEAYWDARSTSWVVSCFLAGVTAALLLASAHQRRYEAHLMLGNRYH